MNSYNHNPRVCIHPCTFLLSQIESTSTHSRFIVAVQIKCLLIHVHCHFKMLISTTKCQVEFAKNPKYSKSMYLRCQPNLAN